MSKNNFVLPRVFLSTSPEPTDVIVIGGGSGQGGVTGPDAMSFDDWLISEWAEDTNQMNGPDIWDYVMWWEGWGFSRAQWELLNPGYSWDEYFGDD